MPDKRRGFDGNVYLNAATPGIDGTPQSFQAILSAQDIKAPEVWDTYEAPDRGTLVKLYMSTMVDWSVDFKIVFDRTDPHHIALQRAFRQRSRVAAWVADGPSDETGSSGPYADWLVKEFGKDMPLKDGMTIDVKLVPHANRRFNPQYLEVGVAPAVPGRAVVGADADAIL